MGFKDFLVKIGIAQKTGDEPQISRELKLEEIQNWVSDEERYIENKEKEIFGEIKQNINSFSEEINEKLGILKSLDVGSKKAEDRIKILVSENKDNYCSVVFEFLESVAKLELRSLGSLIESSHKMFENFERKSHQNYEKTTILIGKEISDIKEKIRSLSKYLSQTFKSGEWIIKSRIDVDLIKSKLREIQETDKLAQKIDEDVKVLSNKIIDIEDKIDNTNEEIEKIKLTSDYIENQKARNKILQINNEIADEVSLLRAMIDFRALSNFYHISEKEMKIVKEYKEDFFHSFDETNGAEILRLLNESKLNTDEIRNKHGFILELKKKTEDLQSSLKKDMTEFLRTNIYELNSESEGLDREKQKKAETYDKILAKKQSFVCELKILLGNFNLALVE